MDMLSYMLGRKSGANAGGGSKIEAYDIIITSEEQFLAERVNFSGKKILVKDVKFTLDTMDFNHAAYVEFCNVAIGSDMYTVTIKNFEIGNFVSLARGWDDGDSYYYCDDLYINNFSFVENLIPSDGGVHGNGDKIEYTNGYGIMNCAMSAAMNCCNIINCHVIGRSNSTFSNCKAISNLHAKDFGGSGITFDTCSHLSNISLTGVDPSLVTYNSCSKVCADTCDGYSG